MPRCAWQAGVNHGAVHPFVVEETFQGFAEGVVATDDPVSAGRLRRGFVALTGAALQAGDEFGDCRAAQRGNQAQGENLVGVDDGVGIKRFGVGAAGAGVGAADNLETRLVSGEQAGSQRHFDIHRFGIGDGNHGAAVRRLHPCFEQEFDAERVAIDGKHAVHHGIKCHTADAHGIFINDDALVTGIQQQMDKALPRFAETADNAEFVPLLCHLAGKATLTEGVLEGRVLQQGDNLTDGVEPRRHRVIDTERHPHPLPLGKRLRHLAVADGGRGIADPVKGLKEGEIRRLALAIYRWNQRDAEHGDGVGDKQYQRRTAHLPQDEINDFVHCASAAQGGGFDDDQHHRDNIGDERAGGERDDSRHRAGFEQRDGKRPGADSAEKLDIGDEAGSKHERTKMRAVAEFHDGADQADDKSKEQFELVVMLGVADFAIDEPEIEGQRQKDKKAEPDTFTAHDDSVIKRKAAVF